MPARLPRIVFVVVLGAAGTLGTAGTAGTQDIPGTPGIKGLTGAAEVARLYEAIIDARFDEIAALAARSCPPAPAEACQLLQTVAVWWRIQLDPSDRRHDAEFQRRVEGALVAATSWTAREPARAEAWFYLAGAYGARAQWRVLRGHRLAAARDGARIRNTLLRALALDPDLADASFALGLYRYYADVAPTALKILRWILLLPGGDREAGLQLMLRARREGLVAAGEADYQLHLVYLWYEQEPQRALALLHELVSRHPRNPHFRKAIAEVQDVYFGDVHASLATWDALLEAARTGQIAEPAIAERHARRGIARAQAALRAQPRR
jgi:hypothetical protein